MPKATLHVGDALETLSTFEDKRFQTCVTSPPYWGLRDYGEEEQLGLEETPEEYVQNLVQVFREVRRTLRDDGTVWVNLGTSYVSEKTESKKMKLREDLTQEEIKYVLEELKDHA